MKMHTKAEKSVKRIKARLPPTKRSYWSKPFKERLAMLQARYKSKWQPAPDMNPRLAFLVLRGKACGCALAGGAGYCARAPENAGLRKIRGMCPPYPCAHHQKGGAPVGNVNGIVHGFYANAILPGEEALAEKLKQDDLATEILLWKLKLRRVLVAIKRQEEALESASQADKESAMQTEKKISKYEKQLVVRRFKNAQGEGRKKLVNRLVEIERIVEKVLPDLYSRSDTIARTLVRLTMAQASLHGLGEDEKSLDYHKKAELARRMIDKVREDA